MFPLFFSYNIELCPKEDLLNFNNFFSCVNRKREREKKWINQLHSSYLNENHNLSRVWYFLKHLFGHSPTLHLVHRNLVRVCWPKTEQTRHRRRFGPDSGQCCIFCISSLSIWLAADAERPLEILRCDENIQKLVPYCWDLQKKLAFPHWAAGITNSFSETLLNRFFSKRYIF